MKIPFRTKKEINDYSDKYDDEEKFYDPEKIDIEKLSKKVPSSIKTPRNLEDHLICRMPNAVSCGYINEHDLNDMAYWKGRLQRGLSGVEKNANQDIINISKASFATNCEYVRIVSLKSLKGVDWPMASVILHFVYGRRSPEKQYPILDIYTMEAVKGSTSYSFKRWKQYTDLCRETARKFGLPSLRHLDRALWSYGKELMQEERPPKEPRND